MTKPAMKNLKTHSQTVFKYLYAFLRIISLTGIVVSLFFLLLSILNVGYFCSIDIPGDKRGIINLFFLFVLLLIFSWEKAQDYFFKFMAAAEKLFGWKYFFLAMSIAVLSCYILMSLSMYFSLRYNEEAGLLERTVYDSYNGKFLFNSLYNKSFLAEHFSAALLFFIPLHYFFRDLLTMQFVCVFLVWGSGLILRKIMQAEGHNDSFTGYICFIFYNCQIAVAALDIHFEQFLMPGVFMMFLAYIKKWRVCYWLSVILILLIKEDSALYLAGFSLFIMLNDKRYGAGAATFIASISWFIFVFLAGMPAFTDGVEYKFLKQNYAAWGGTFPEMLKSFIMHPLKLFKALFAERYLSFFAGLGLLPFFNPAAVLIFIPAWLVPAISANPDQNRLIYYYGIPLLAFSSIAAIIGFRTKLFRERIGIKAKYVLAAAILIVNTGYFKFYEVERENINFIKQVKEIPAGSTVLAGYQACGYIEKNCNIIKWNNKMIDADYIVLAPKDIKYQWLNLKRFIPERKYSDIAENCKCHILKKIK
jgi:uncharacterized membrane protein